MKHLKRPRTIIILLLLICGGLLAVILRQRATLDQFARYGESDKQHSLTYAAFALDSARRNVPGLHSDAGKQLSPDAISDYLERAVAELEKAQIHMDAYEALRRRSDEQPIIVFDQTVFQEYKAALYSVMRGFGQQDAVTPEQRAILAAVDHDLGALYDVTFDHVMLVQDGANRQDGRLSDQPLPNLIDSIQAITPTLKVNTVRQRLGLFPSIFPQENSNSGGYHLSLTLHASTTCAEVGQPVTLTLELERSGPADPPIALESVDIIIGGSGPKERWSASGGAPKPGEPTLAAGESRTYEWVWAASEAFSNTTVLVEAEAKISRDSPKPTPDPNGAPVGNPVTVDLQLGVGVLTQSGDDQRSFLVRGSTRPRSLPCAQMVR
jgi:hypothetical protein